VKLPLYQTDPASATRYPFFTGKGGVGKLSECCGNDGQHKQKKKNEL
jgi:hypothetical protein